MLFFVETVFALQVSKKRTPGAKQAAEKCLFGEESNPQRLKPNPLRSIYVRAKARTLQRSEFF
jgi:hypothetical protein